MNVVHSQGVGDLLRKWRTRRRLSQLEFATEANISTRHLSFLETGRSLPSRDMLLHLAEQLQIPLRERNVLLVAAGYAPVFPERPLDDPALAAARKAIEQVLAAHQPYPALAIDRHWSLIASNNAVAPLLAGVTDALLQPPVNVLRLSLHPEGLAPRIANLAEWRAHLLARLRRQIELSADPVLVNLLNDLGQYPSSRARSSRPIIARASAEVAVPFQLIKNLTETLQRVFDQHRSRLDAVRGVADQPAAAPADELSITARRSAATQRAERRTQRQTRYQEVRQLHASGLTRTQIAARVGLSRKTVSRWLNTTVYPAHPGAKRRGRPYGSQLDPFKPYLLERFQAGCHNARRLYQEIQAQAIRAAIHWCANSSRYYGVQKGREHRCPPNRRHAIPFRIWCSVSYGDQTR